MPSLAIVSPGRSCSMERRRVALAATRLILVPLAAAGALVACRPAPTSARADLICGEAVVPARVGDTQWRLPGSETHFGSGVRRGRDGELCRTRDEPATPEAFSITGLPGDSPGEKTTFYVAASQDPGAFDRLAKAERDRATGHRAEEAGLSFERGSERYFLSNGTRADQFDTVICTTTPVGPTQTGEMRFRCIAEVTLSATVAAKVTFFVADISEASAQSRSAAVASFIATHRTGTANDAV